MVVTLQQEQENKNKKNAFGELILAATHIGQPLDTPIRTLEALKTADLLVFEEIKPAHLLLKTAGIKREFLLYNEHQDQKTIKEVAKTLKEGQTVLYCSDQGSPALADPGYELAKLAITAGHRISIIPGPSSLTAACSAFPYKLERFYFAGFPPKEAKARESFLADLDHLSCPIIMMDTPYRLGALLSACGRLLKRHKKGFLAINASMEDEVYLMDNFKNLEDKVKDIGKKNFVLIAT